MQKVYPPQPPEIEARLNTLFALLREEPDINDSQRQMLQDRISSVLNYHAKIGVLGKTGVGKSTLCNALFGERVAAVSDVMACTREPQDIAFATNHGKGITLIDMPGVGEDEDHDREYAGLYSNMLPELDLVLWLIKADDRALAADLHWHDTVVKPYCMQNNIPLLVVISQIDKMEPVNQWDWDHGVPGPDQHDNIERKAAQLMALFDLPPSRIATVSGGLNVGLTDLVEKIIRALPHDKRWGVTRETKPENISPQAQHDTETGLWETIRTAVCEIVKEGAEFVICKLTTMAHTLFGWLR